MDKKHLSERDICRQFITPAVVNAGWDLRMLIPPDEWNRGK